VRANTLPHYERRRASVQPHPPRRWQPSWPREAARAGDHLSCWGQHWLASSAD